LIVDDEDSIRQILARLLTGAGYARVVTASSVHEARGLLAEDSFDLLLTDMQMPGGSGLDLLGFVHAEFPLMATMMVTGLDDAHLAQSALDLGAHGFIIKPFKATEVLINVDSALRHKALESRSRIDLEQAESDIDESRTDTVTRLAKAAEFRDEETGRHVLRMSRYCELLAQASGQDDNLIHYIREASALHDVGKIGIPDSILLKPSSLTVEEREIMHGHAQIGYEILSGSSSPLLNLSASIASTHHERMDATGYPRHLKGDEIPVAGRIAAVADVFDALTTDRAYRPAFPLSTAVEMMTAESGQHFDPDLLDCFWNDVLPDFRAAGMVVALDRDVRTAKVLEGAS
jgi:putative two-component system response regulator